MGKLISKVPSLLVVTAVLTVAIWLRPEHDLPVVNARQPSAASSLQLQQDGQDARTTAAIEALLAGDSRLAARAIDVSTTEGRVTLSGRVDSASDVVRAIQLAFRNSDVRQVISTLQIAQPVARAASPSRAR